MVSKPTCSIDMVRILTNTLTSPLTLASTNIRPMKAPEPVVNINIMDTRVFLSPVTPPQAQKCPATKQYNLSAMMKNMIPTTVITATTGMKITLFIIRLVPRDCD